MRPHATATEQSLVQQDARAIALIVQAIPPTHDAIGEYTARLSIELAKACDVNVMTSTSSGRSADVEGVEIEACFDLCGPQRFANLLERLVKTNADSVILQYNPFAWGRRGWAPDLVRTVESFKRARPDVCLAVMFHETYMMNPGFRSWVMRLYQRRQFQRLTAIADVCFFSTELWANQLSDRDPNARSVHLPVGSNLPLSAADPLVTRQKWSIGENDFVCGVFGGNHPSRMVPWIDAAVDQMNRENDSGRKMFFLHVGGDKIDWSVPAIPTIVTGRLSATEAADAIAIMDLMINPFSDGISTRRGSAMAALQHGVPVLTTRGHATESLWDDEEGRCVFRSPNDCRDRWLQACREAWQATVARDANRRESIKRFYRNHFDWPVIAGKLLTSLAGTSPHRL